MQASLRTLTRCLVCGFSEVRTDEVVDRGLVLLHECPRCDHRWTQRGATDFPVRERLARASRRSSGRSAA
jgi:Zn-finger nucleic acid-binding protein